MKKHTIIIPMPMEWSEPLMKLAKSDGRTKTGFVRELVRRELLKAQKRKGTSKDE